MDNNLDNECIRCIIKGRVQGVFFRVSTQKQASQYGIVGYAKNLVDGSVEVIACCSTSKLEKLKQWLHRGPSGAQVSSVDCESVQTEKFLDFRTY